MTLDHINLHSMSLKLVWPLWQSNSVNGVDNAPMLCRSIVSVGPVVLHHGSVDTSRSLFNAGYCKITPFSIL